MLLPSALSFGEERTTRSSSMLYASPPTSPATSTLLSTCRALHSMLSSSSSPPPSAPTQLPTPPMSHAPAPLMSGAKLRLRARKPAENENTTQRRRIAKRAPPRGINKRRRAMGDEVGRDESDDDNDDEERDAEVQEGPRTPKRARMSPLVPEILPRGLERGDFWSLQNQNQDQNSNSNQGQWQEEAHQQHQFSSQAFFPSFGGIPQYPGIDSNMNMNSNSDGGMMQSSEAPASVEEPEAEPEWTSDEDRVLVELVLEKLKLTKSEWADCARSLGRDRGSVGRRWRSLVGGGEVGLKRRGGARKGIHATWR